MCYDPLNLKHREAVVPCGKCAQCKARRTSAWSFRLMQEDKDAENSQFITLTYDTTEVPITRNGFMSLVKRDLQLFFKRLRKAQSKYVQAKLGNKEDEPLAAKRIKYYAVGEYGGHTKRPHYHIILFNARIELIQPAWNKGHTHYGTVSGASIGYTLKYISKPSKVPLHRNDDRIKEFSLMSKDLAAVIYQNQISIGISPIFSNECISPLKMEKKSLCLVTTKIKSTSKVKEMTLLSIRKFSCGKNSTIMLKQ